VPSFWQDYSHLVQLNLKELSTYVTWPKIDERKGSEGRLLPVHFDYGVYRRQRRQQQQFGLARPPRPSLGTWLVKRFNEFFGVGFGDRQAVIAGIGLPTILGAAVTAGSVGVAGVQTVQAQEAQRRENQKEVQRQEAVKNAENLQKQKTEADGKLQTLETENARNKAATCATLTKAECSGNKAVCSAQGLISTTSGGIECASEAETILRCVMATGKAAKTGDLECNTGDAPECKSGETSEGQQCKDSSGKAVAIATDKCFTIVSAGPACKAGSKPAACSAGKVKSDKTGCETSTATITKCYDEKTAKFSRAGTCTANTETAVECTDMNKSPDKDGKCE